MNFQIQMKVLLQLALVDNTLSTTEKNWIYNLGKANGMPESDINDLFEGMLLQKHHEIPPIENLTEEDKFEYLFNLIQLMKVDKEVYLSEVKFCEELAVKLGYKKKVIKALSSKIFSDPSIISDHGILRSIVSKHIVI